jgi:hypothetical protein
MKRLMFVLAVAVPTAAYAQGGPVPVTLSGEEYQRIVNDLAARDPIVAMLLQKEREAKAKAPAPKSDAPPADAAPK